MNNLVKEWGYGIAPGKNRNCRTYDTARHREIARQRFYGFGVRLPNID
jgi:hypothetical protein